jgi:hypothetical protein
LNLEVGTVIRWDNFPDPRFDIDNEIKARWFICLGFSGIFAQIAVVYLSTTTTQLQHYKESGKRKNHSHFIFQTNQYPTFEKDCVIDFSEQPYPATETKLKSCQNDININIMGKLTEDTMRMIFKRFSRSGSVAPKVLGDIHTSYNNAGITSLQKPKHHKKKRKR